MAVRKRHDGRYQIEFQQAGERVFRRLPAFAGKADAVALETKLRRDIFERHTLGRAEEPSLAAAIEAWLQATQARRKDPRNPRQNARHLARFIGDAPLRQVGDVAQAAAKAWAADLSPATINRRLDVLRASARHAWKQGWIADNLTGRIPRMREENARQVYLQPAEIRTLASHAPTDTCAAAIMLAAYTGLRASELLALGPVIKGADSLTVAHSKTGRPRQVPIVPLLRKYLSALPLGLTYWQLQKQFNVARAAAEMGHVHFHDLRHSCASMLINAGVDLFTVGRILGHSTPQTTARYAHLSTASLRKAMAKLR